MRAHRRGRVWPPIWGVHELTTLFYDQLLIVRILAAVVMWSPLAWMFWDLVRERQRARLQAILGAERDREVWARIEQQSGNEAYRRVEEYEEI